jgi:hypothetical protein
MKIVNRNENVDYDLTVPIKKTLNTDDRFIIHPYSAMLYKFYEPSFTFSGLDETMSNAHNIPNTN